MNNTVIVYWAYFAIPERNTFASLMSNPPVPVLKTLPKLGYKDAPGRNYISCKALSNLYKNTFLVTSPIDANIYINHQDDMCFAVGENSIFFNPKTKAFEDMSRVDLDFSYIFFAEESLEMVQTPTFLHKTNFSENAYVASGSFDISKWFRPIEPAFIFWKDRSELVLKKDDPLFYVDFRTNKKVILKRFNITAEILEIVRGSLAYRDANPMSSLQDLYKRFTDSKRNKKVAQIIKENLID